MAAGWRVAAALAVALLGGCASLRDSTTRPYVSSFSGSAPGAALPPGWEQLELSVFKRPTQYQLVTLDGRTVVKANAQASASGLVHRLSVDTRQFPLLEWRWKVNELIATADNTQKHTEDSPVRILVGFDGDTKKLPHGERLFLDNIGALTGRRLPYAMLVYIWENHAAKDTIIPNLHTSRVKMIVAESGTEKLGQWQEVTRNVYEDYKRAFGEEPGAVISIGIMTDTDNTGGNAHAYYGDIQFRRMPPPREVVAND